ncbi:LysR family transcriptional regulator [Dechloromonas denitrificans]|uniref:LysR family transcriptional regulator n=1 Tax=Dechloromonas denitrificans TaxID=281362 RepID=UPI001CF85D5B|nr:LysR family transcriptional regulator [Dechloromonas denitrificans]UCV02556.1 LysR family transcriptional regulator [Dechloromonas denitrificans]
MDRPSLADLQAFATVARLRSFRRAAGELHVSPSALSHTLRSLETRLGVRLLNRTTRSVSPTEAGQRLLARLAPTLQELDDALDEINSFRDSPVGTLRLNVPRAAAEYVLAPLASRFLRENPGMRLEIVIDDSLIDIVAAGFDAGVRFGERLAQDMIAVPFGPAQRFVVVASPAYLAEHGKPAAPQQLSAHRCIRIRFPNGSIYRWEFSRGDEKIEVEVEGPLDVGEMWLMVRAAEDGVGLAYVYEQSAASALAAGRLVTVLDDWRPPEPGFFLYYPSRRLVPAGLRAFIDLLQKNAET